MKICVTAQGESIDAKVDPRFGRCQYFIIIDTDSSKFESSKNQNIETTGGAGIQSGQFMAQHGVNVVLTGNVGPNAFQTLQAAKIDVITGVSGTVKEVVEKFNKGEYKKTDGPSVGSKFGINR